MIKQMACEHLKKKAIVSSQHGFSENKSGQADLISLLMHLQTNVHIIVVCQNGGYSTKIQVSYIYPLWSRKWMILVYILFLLASLAYAFNSVLLNLRLGLARESHTSLKTFILLGAFTCSKLAFI
jgi:hypothetical protein